MISTQHTETQACDSSLSAHMKVGKDGEIIAAEYLRLCGYLICARNVRLKKDEIDIIAFDSKDRTLVFVEVKTRSTYSAYYRPELNFTHAKKTKMLRAARTWVYEHEFEGGYRCDLVCVANKKVMDHFKDACSDERRTRDACCWG